MPTQISPAASTRTQSLRLPQRSDVNCRTRAKSNPQKFEDRSDFEPQRPLRRCDVAIDRVAERPSLRLQLRPRRDRVVRGAAMKTATHPHARKVAKHVARAAFEREDLKRALGLERVVE